MDVIEMTRKLGATIQQDERYAKFQEARKGNDENAELQDLIGQFNLKRLSLDTELQKEDGKDDAKVKELNGEMRSLYGEIMCNPAMVAYNQAKGELENMVKSINAIIDMCINGEDPETCQPETGCTGSCASCSGCH